MKYIIDSSAWIEYLEGSKSGEEVSKILKKEEVFVIPIIISEVISYVKRNKGNIEIAYESIIKNSKILEITPRIAKEAGLLHASKKEKGDNFPLADALILCSAMDCETKIITTDHHFKPFKEAIIL